MLKFFKKLWGKKDEEEVKKTEEIKEKEEKIEEEKIDSKTGSQEEQSEKNEIKKEEKIVSEELQQENKEVTSFESKEIKEEVSTSKKEEEETQVLEEKKVTEEEKIEYKEKPQDNPQLGWLERLKLGLTKTRESFTKKIKELVGRKHQIDDEFKEELEEILISTDLGVRAMEKIMFHFEEIAQMERIEDHQELLELLKEIFFIILDEEPEPLKLNSDGLTVIMMVGVNGTGKTTTIGKLAQKFKEEGKSVMVAAGDTFRAAAIEQLETWANRVGCDIIKHQAGADAAAVVFDAVKAALARKKDILLIDTAGRLHTKSNLMEELKKVKRVIQKVMPDAPHETLLVLDSTTGQNGINQAKVFNQEIGVTGLILTKLDGTAKGGVVVAIKEELKLPVKYIGVGEKVEDLHQFSPKEFIEALLS